MRYPDSMLMVSNQASKTKLLTVGYRNCTASGIILSWKWKDYAN